MNDASPQAPRVGILDYGMGNLRSVHRAFLAAGADASIVEHPHEMDGMQALVFPGQGAIVDTMRLLQARGWTRYLKDWIEADRPFFGICLGLQALFEFSEEGDTKGLGILPGAVRRFRFDLESGIKIPHMGWNDVVFKGDQDSQSLLQGIRPDAEQFYFVHSYFVVPSQSNLMWGETEYGGLRFCSAVRRGNLLATQFHPEKSQQMGLRLYENFLGALKTGCE